MLNISLDEYNALMEAKEEMCLKEEVKALLENPKYRKRMEKKTEKFTNRLAKESEKEAEETKNAKSDEEREKIYNRYFKKGNKIGNKFRDDINKYVEKREKYLKKKHGKDYKSPEEREINTQESSMIIGYYVNEDGSKELVELSEIELKGIENAREIISEKSSFDKCIKSKIKESKKHKTKAEELEKLANNTPDKKVKEEAMKKAEKHKKASEEKAEGTDYTYEELEKMRKNSNKNNFDSKGMKAARHYDGLQTGQDLSDDTKDKEKVIDARRKTRGIYKSKGKTPEESYPAGRYLNAQKAIKAAKEAVIEWYEENDFNIDGYEMGRIDSFVESYCSKY